MIMPNIAMDEENLVMRQPPNDLMVRTLAAFWFDCADVIP
jgi:hypothetical protein